MIFAVDVWPTLSFCVMLFISLLSIVSNGLTILALRKSYGLRKLLGPTSFMLVGCLSLMHFCNGLFGIPLSAIDRIREENWPPPHSGWSVSATCIITVLPGIVLYNSALWYLISIALVRFGLVFWPHGAKRVLDTRVAKVLACLLPFLMGLVPTVYGVATKSVRFGKSQSWLSFDFKCFLRFLLGVRKEPNIYSSTDHCAPIPYDDTTPEGNMRMQIYQLITLAWSLVLPVPTSFGLYIAMGIKLFIQERAKEGRSAVVAAGGGRMGPSVFSIHSSTRAQTSKHGTATNGTLQSQILARSNPKLDGANSGSSAIAPVAAPTDNVLELKPLREISAVPPSGEHAASNSTVPPKVQKHRAKALAAHQRKYRVVQMLAYAYVVNIMCICPVYILWLTGFYYSVEQYSASAMFAEAIDWLYLFAAPMDSIMYAVVSTDFRKAYKRILKCN